MTTKVFIPISQLAIIVGLSKYGSLTQIMLKLWIKTDFEGYSKKILELEQKYNKSFGLINEFDKMQLLANELGLNDLINKTNTTIKNENNIMMKNNKNAIYRDIDHARPNNNLSQTEIDDKKKILSKLVNNITNCGYGQYNENSAINIYSTMTNTIISDQQKKIIAIIKTTDINTKIIEWNLIGKIDGIATNKNGEQTLIEIKNRVNTLFNHLKDYEKPQIQAYMKLTGFKHAHMVEHIGNETGIIMVEYDSKYWKLIKERLNHFIDFFINFINNQKLQELLLLDGQYNDMIDIHFRKLLDGYF
jgi:hypothetical protein